MTASISCLRIVLCWTFFLLLGTLAITSVPLFMSFQKMAQTSMISAYQFILLNFSMQVAGLFEYFSFKLYETL